MARRQSLEELIKASRIEVEEHEDRVFIDRSHFASRKRGRIAVVSKSRDLIGSPLEEIDGNSEAGFWRAKYEQLRAERRDAEEDLEQQLEIALQREAKMDAYSKLLEKKVELLQAGKVSRTDATELADKLEVLRKTLAFYEQLTSSTVRVDSSEEYTVTVRHTAKATHTTRFKIGMPASEALSGDRKALGISYEPAKDANVQLLPEYLQQDLECEGGMMPVILCDILTKLYLEGNDENH